MTDKQPEALIRADELEAIGAESSLARAMAAHTIRLLHKENEALRARLDQPEPTKLINVNGVLEKAGYVKKKEWHGLTDDEVIKVYGEAVATVNASWDGTGQVGLIFPIAVYKEYERILKEKNA